MSASHIDYTVVAAEQLGLTYGRRTHTRIKRHAEELLRTHQATGRHVDPHVPTQRIGGPARRAQCVRGHALIEGNFYRTNTGRTCRQCKLDRERARRERKQFPRGLSQPMVAS